jgi:hypothetical protein
MAQMRPGRFGRQEAVIKVVERDGKYPRGYVQIGSKMYRVTCSNGQKDDKNGNPIRYWVNLQEMPRSGGMSSGYNRGGY